MSITRKLATRFTNYNNKSSAGFKFRSKRIAPLLAMIDEISVNSGSVNIIDIGGTEQYWEIIPNNYLTDRNVKITIVNLPGNIVAEDHDQFSFIYADGCDLALYDDESFQIAHSNSVIEHVGDWDRMVQFAKELSRVSNRYFVQTPNFWFPIEPHCMTPFFHWLPKPIRIWLLLHFQLGHWGKASSTDQAVRTVESARLLNKKMVQELFSDADVLCERFLGMAKSFIAIKN